MTTATKRCPACGLTKLTSEFSPSRNSRGDKLNAYCRPCSALRVTQWRKNNPEKSRRGKTKNYHRNRVSILLRRRASKYGTTVPVLLSMLVSQNGACPICATTLDLEQGRSWHVDHCHTTHLIRGLLCWACNPAIGLARHSPAVLRKMAEYLEVHQSATKQEHT